MRRSDQKKIHFDWVTGALGSPLESKFILFLRCVSSHGQKWRLETFINIPLLFVFLSSMEQFCGESERRTLAAMNTFVTYDDSVHVICIMKGQDMYIKIISKWACSAVTDVCSSSLSDQNRIFHTGCCMYMAIVYNHRTVQKEQSIYHIVVSIPHRGPLHHIYALMSIEVRENKSRLVIPINL